jgi:hypothetical protein
MMKKSNLTICVAWNGTGDLSELLDRADSIDWVSEVMVSPSSSEAHKIASGYQIKYPKLKLLNPGDRGIYSAWNKMIATCHTTHLCFHGIDDLILPDSSLGEYIKSAMPNDLLVFNIRYYTSEGEFSKTSHHKVTQPPKVALGRYTTPATPEIVYPVEILRELGGADESFIIAGDADLYFKLISRVQRIDVMIDFAEMRDGGASSSAKHSWTVLSENRRIAKKYGHKITIFQKVSATLALGFRSVLFNLFGERIANKATDLLRASIGKSPRFSQHKPVI